MIIEKKRKRKKGTVLITITIMILPVIGLIGEPIVTLNSGSEVVMWLIKLVPLLQLVSLSDVNNGGCTGHLSLR